jgi:bacillithiol biosynthesis cysteine-adding enzyme BshC
MRSICIPHTELPGTSSLFGDYLYRFDRVSGFYAHDPHDPDSIRRAGLAVNVADDRRQRLANALRRLNGENASVDVLELPDTVAVVAGQQVGLFSGPAFSIYKALTAAKLARQLSESGLRAVPVFWLATEDHDLAEADHAWVFDKEHRPVRLRAGSSAPAGTPVGRIGIESLPLEELRSALGGFLFGDEVIALVEDAYRPGRTFGEAFRVFLSRLLAGYGLVFIDPLDPEFRDLAAPLLHEALERAPELSGRLAERGEELARRGYHAQVLFEPQTSLFFRLENGRRLHLRRNGDDYYDGLRRVPRQELAADPAALSPSALLRPVMQDFLLPTAAYVGGPAEIAYLAQSQVLYQSLLARMPLAVPRSGFTLLDERSRMLMEKYNATFADCFHGEAALRQKIAARLVPDSLDIAFEQTASEVRSLFDRLQGELAGFDPTLGAALSKSREKVLYQIGKNRRKAAREALRREGRVSAGVAHLSGLVYPEHHLQERLYSILPFLAKHGFDLIDTLYENIYRGCPDHILLTV